MLFTWYIQSHISQPQHHKKKSLQKLPFTTNWMCAIEIVVWTICTPWNARKATNYWISWLTYHVWLLLVSRCEAKSTFCCCYIVYNVFVAVIIGLRTHFLTIADWLLLVLFSVFIWYGKWQFFFIPSWSRSILWRNYFKAVIEFIFFVFLISFLNTRMDIATFTSVNLDFFVARNTYTVILFRQVMFQFL